MNNKKDNIKAINYALLQKHFNNVISGYHCISKEPLKEAMWENINVEVLESSKYKIFSTASGSHISGCDIKSDIGNLSNKTGIIINNKISISSYRLGRVCNVQNPGCIDDITKTIKEKNNTFDYYSLLARDKNKDKTKYTYYWFLIPKSADVFELCNYAWNKANDKKGAQNGWKTTTYKNCSMKINFSMSSQLWLKISIDEIKKYKIAEKHIDLTKCQNIKYGNLNDIVNNLEDTLKKLKI